MQSVADYATEFARRAKAGQRPRVYVERQHVESFLLMLAREGMQFARDCLAQISDPELRRIIETIFFSTVAGAAAGATLGAVVGGAPGAKVGAVVGASVGFAAGCVAVTIVATQKGSGLQLSVEPG